jgi:hypothetical protein
VKSSPSPSPFSSLLLPPHFFDSSEAQLAYSEVLFIAGDLSWFNNSSSFSSTADGPIAASTCRPQPWVCPLLKVLRFDFFQNQICPLREALPPHAPLYRDLGFLCSALPPAASPFGHHAPKRVPHTPTRGQRNVESVGFLGLPQLPPNSRGDSSDRCFASSEYVVP